MTNEKQEDSKIEKLTDEQLDFIGGGYVPNISTINKELQEK